MEARDTILWLTDSEHAQSENQEMGGAPSACMRISK